MGDELKIPSQESGASDPPSCNCALLCEDVLIGQKNQKHTLVGVIGLIQTPVMPIKIDGFVAYVRVSNIIGDKDIEIGVIAADTNEWIIKGVAQIPNPNNHQLVRTIISPLPPFQIPSSGVYFFVAACDGVPLAYSPIRVQGPPEVGEDQQ